MEAEVGETQTELSQKALARRKTLGIATHRPATAPHSHEGLNDQPRPDYPPSGAFDAEGHRPVLERSRKVR